MVWRSHPMMPVSSRRRPRSIPGFPPGHLLIVPPGHRTSRDKGEQPEERGHVPTLRVGRAIQGEVNKQDRRGKRPSSPRGDRMQSLVGHCIRRPGVYQNYVFSTLSLEDIKMPPKIVPGMISTWHSLSLSKASVQLPSYLSSHGGNYPPATTVSNFTPYQIKTLMCLDQAISSKHWHILILSLFLQGGQRVLFPRFFFPMLRWHLPLIEFFTTQ